MTGTGTAQTIIKEALRLGILARPCLGHGMTAIGVGEALTMTQDGVYHVSASDLGNNFPFQVTPAMLMRDWELTTIDLIRDEYRKVCEVPW